MSAHCLASNFTGLNCGTSVFSYAIGSALALVSSHSPTPGQSLPSHTPAGVEYSPKWMNIPKRAERHHAMRASRSARVSLSAGGGALTAVDAASMEPRTTAADAAASVVRMGGG